MDYMKYLVRVITFVDILDIRKPFVKLFCIVYIISPY